MPPTFSIASTLVYDQAAESHALHARASSLISTIQAESRSMADWQKARVADRHPQDDLVEDCITQLDHCWLNIVGMDGMEGTSELEVYYIDQLSRE